MTRNSCEAGVLTTSSSVFSYQTLLGGQHNGLIILARDQCVAPRRFDLPGIQLA